MTDLHDLLDDVAAFAHRTGVKTSTLSGKLFGDGLRYEKLRTGQVTITYKLLERAREKLTTMIANQDKLDAQLEEAGGVLS